MTTTTERYTAKILAGLSDNKPHHIDWIARNLGLPRDKIFEALLFLELSGQIKQYPGKFFARI